MACTTSGFHYLRTIIAELLGVEPTLQSCQDTCRNM